MTSDQKQDEILKRLDEIHARLDQIEGEIRMLRQSQSVSEIAGTSSDLVITGLSGDENSASQEICFHPLVPDYSDHKYKARY